MDGQNVGEQDAVDSSATRKQFNSFFEQFFSEALDSPQNELFYSQQAAQLQEINSECIPALTRRLQKATWSEQDVLVQLLAQFRGVEHVSFLQEFVGREAFMPKTGMKILDIFNKSDVIIDSGVASRLLDYDNFIQRIMQTLMSGTVSDELAGEFLACGNKERDGILAQVLEDHGPHSAPFLAGISSRDKKAGERVLGLLGAYADEKGFRVMEAMYAENGRKDILKRMKKVARALGQKGIKVSLPETPAKSGSVFQSAGLSPARAFASTIDAEGFRLLFIVKPVSTYESKIFHIITNDSTGIKTLDVYATHRGETAQVIKKLFKDTKSDFREFSAARCVALVMEALELSRSQNGIVPATISQLEAQFADDIAKKSAPEIYDVISADEIAALESAPDTGALVGTMELAFWYIVTSEGKACWEKLARRAADRKKDADENHKEQMRVWAEAELACFFTAGRKHAFKRRLEEFAGIFHAKGYVDQARAALCAALNLAAPDHDPGQDPFCRTIIDRAFEVFQQSLDANEEKKRSAAANSAAMKA
jgi:hypothetical protein